METIRCQKCGTEIEIDKALEKQVEARVLASIKEQHNKELEKTKKETKSSTEKMLKEQFEIERENDKQENEFLIENLESKYKRDIEKNSQKQELLIEQLRDDAEDAKETNKELREELKKLNKSFLDERRAKDKAEIEAEKKLTKMAGEIREEAIKNADEANRFKQAELEKKLNDTLKALDEAQRKAEQGSQQTQGEVLELELEALLRSEFPTDDIEEVKKGQRGADIKQYVKNSRLEDCGVLLWESKNAKWSKAWIAKMKDDIREANATVGVIVSSDLPDEYNDMHQIESNIWIVKPKFIFALAAAVRTTLIQVFSAHRNAENKDEKMEILYRFLTGIEFRNRIEAIVDNYKTLQDEIENEKRASAKRWAKQEKAIRAVIDNTYGLYGDLQGIAGSELQIPLLEEENDDTE